MSQEESSTPNSTLKSEPDKTSLFETEKKSEKSESCETPKEPEPSDNPLSFEIEENVHLVMKTNTNTPAAPPSSEDEDEDEKEMKTEEQITVTVKTDDITNEEENILTQPNSPKANDEETIGSEDDEKLFTTPVLDNIDDKKSYVPSYLLKRIGVPGEFFSNKEENDSRRVERRKKRGERIVGFTPRLVRKGRTFTEKLAKIKKVNHFRGSQKYCGLCRVVYDSISAELDHITSIRHRENLARKRLIKAAYADERKLMNEPIWNLKKGHNKNSFIKRKTVNIIDRALRNRVTRYRLTEKGQNYYQKNINKNRYQSNVKNRTCDICDDVKYKNLSAEIQHVSGSKHINTVNNLLGRHTVVSGLDNRVMRRSGRRGVSNRRRKRSEMMNSRVSRLEKVLHFRNDVYQPRGTQSRVMRRNSNRRRGGVGNRRRKRSEMMNNRVSRLEKLLHFDRQPRFPSDLRKSTTVMVKNLVPEVAKKNILKSYFTRFGRVRFVKFGPDCTTAVIGFTNQWEADRCLDYRNHGAMYDGLCFGAMVLSMDEASPVTQQLEQNRDDGLWRKDDKEIESVRNITKQFEELPKPQSKFYLGMNQSYNVTPRDLSDKHLITKEYHVSEFNTKFHQYLDIVATIERLSQDPTQNYQCRILQKEAAMLLKEVQLLRSGTDPQKQSLRPKMFAV